MSKLGLWIKDDAQGIGTLTYIDQSYHFGALGHGITDNSTGRVMDISGGKIYNTHIISIVKGQDGTPGELQGIIDYKNSQPIGTISKNSDYGIYGTIDASVCQRHNLQLMNVGYRYMTHKGSCVNFLGEERKTNPQLVKEWSNDNADSADGW